MNIVKSLHPSLIYKSFSHQGKHYFAVSVLWGFDLNSAEPVLEQALWQAIGDALGKNEIFDTGLPKAQAEMLVSGSYFAPAGKRVNAGKVSVSLGANSKELMVFGDRHWIKGMGVGWGVSEPEPFTEMPVNYTRAFGGKDHAQNPLGMGIDEIEGETGPVIPLPNIEYPDQLIGSPKDRPRAASFNRIDMMCQQRMSYAGTYDQKYIETRMPGYPDDLDYRFFNDSAKDQWLDGYLQGDEEYEIRNMNPDHPVISGRIPAVNGRAFVNHEEKGEIVFREIPTRLDTVWFFPSALTGILIYRGLLEVAVDDASDIKQIIIGNENRSDKQRTPEHYRNELAIRTDPKEGFKYMMYTAPLIPEGVKCGFQGIQENSEFPLEMLAKANMDNYASAREDEMKQQADEQRQEMIRQLNESGLPQEEIEKITKQVNAAGEKTTELTPEARQIEAIVEKILPGLIDDPKNLDLSKLNLKAMDELKEYLEKIQKEKHDENTARLMEQVEELKNNTDDPNAAESIEQLENILRSQELPPRLPRINAEEIMEALKTQKDEMEKELLVMQSMGVPDEDLKKLRESMDFDEIENKMHDGLDKANEGYRMGAHYMDKARSPHEGQELDKREELIKAYKSGARTSHGDYAFVDFSDLDLSGIDLSGAYLEYANFTNTNLSNAKLGKAILAHAHFDNTVLDGADLTDANLGSVRFDSSVFSNCNLTGATLGKSSITNTEFSSCSLADRQDMFLETKFDHARFLASDMQKSVFIDADISDCDFSESNLDESNFINPVMQRAKFSSSKLAGVLFVNASGDRSVFDHGKMKNVRFVADSSLNGADLCSAQVNEANFRDCRLNDASFDEAYLHKTDFSGAELKKASFEKARAVEAQFNKADLTYANMRSINLMEGSMQKAVISGAVLVNANLYSVAFHGCTWGQTDFTGADLEKTLFKDWRP